MKIIFILLGIFLSCFCILFLFGPFIKIRYEERFFHRIIGKELYKIAVNHDNFIIHDVEIKFIDGFIHFDHLFFGNKYIYCIRNVYYTYGIEGSNQDLKWFHYDRKGNFEYIENPLKSNKIQMEKMKTYMKVPNDQKFFYSIIVINDDCTFRIHDYQEDEIVIKRSELKKFLKEKENDPNISSFQQKQLEKIVQQIYEQCNHKKET